MAAPTRNELFAKLREIYKASTWEALAHALQNDGVPLANRQLSRWRRGEGMKFEDAVLLLERAGYLSQAPDISQSQNRATARRLRKRFSELADLVEEMRSDLQQMTPDQRPAREA